MELNPFKETDLRELREEISALSNGFLWPINNYIQRKWNSFIKNGKERITVMIVPHTEKKIINLYLSFFQYRLA